MIANPFRSRRAIGVAVLDAPADRGADQAARGDGARRLLRSALSSWASPERCSPIDWSYARAMTDHDRAAARREIADALVNALERRHEVLDVDRGGRGSRGGRRRDRQTARHLARGGEAVMGMSFDRLTKDSRRKIADELDDLNKQLTFTLGERQGRRPDAAAVRAASPTATSSPRAPRTSRRPATVQVGPRASSTTRFVRGWGESTPKMRSGWSPWSARDKVGMVFGELVDREVNVRMWIHPGASRRRATAPRRCGKARIGDGGLFPGGADGRPLAGCRTVVDQGRHASGEPLA